jgi:hypothetical protein
MLETINNDYSLLSSKYHLSNGSLPQNNQLNEVDELIKKFQNYGSDKTKVVKIHDYKNNLIYLHERLVKFCRNNKDVYEIYRLQEETYSKSIESAFNRLYEYMFKKVVNIDQEIYDEIKIIACANRYTRKDLIKNFINKWTSKEKKININL